MTRRSQSSTPLGAPVGRHDGCGGIVRVLAARIGPTCFQCDDCRAQDADENRPHYDPNLLERTGPLTAKREGSVPW